MNDAPLGLASPLPLACGQILPNRLMKAALSEGLGSTTHAPDDRLTRLYTRWGAGGYGLVITGNVMVDRTHLGEPGNVVLEDDRDLDALTTWAKATKDGGSPIWMQINHPGRQANPLATRVKPVAPSAVASGVPGLPAPRALTEYEILDIVDRFAGAASVAEAAGFDGVQIHGAHGYLVSQFLSPLSNRREDRWGGNLDGRMRFVLEVVRAIRAAVSPGFAVGIKLNSADFQRGGFDEAESRETVEHLAGERLDLIEISGGSYEAPAMMGRATVSASTAAREAYFLEYAREVRIAAGDVPLAVTGGFRTREAMNRAVAERDCDVIGLGRPTTVVPDAAQRLIDSDIEQLESPRITLGLPARLANASALKALDGALDLQWHTDQLHLLGGGDDADPARPAWRTAATMIERNGIGAFRSRRGAPAVPKDRLAAKFRRERFIGRYLSNPAMRGLTAVGIRPSMVTDIETVGRKTGLARRVPVSATFDDDGAWIICQHGTRSGWGANLTADSNIRILVGDEWRSATASFVPDDDVVARARTFAGHPAFRTLVAAGFRALETTPVSVRVRFAPE